MDVKQLKDISDALDERERILNQREKVYRAEKAALEDKQATLKSAYKEFKDLLTKLDKHYDK